MCVCVYIYIYNLGGGIHIWCHWGFVPYPGIRKSNVLHMLVVEYLHWSRLWSFYSLYIDEVSCKEDISAQW